MINYKLELDDSNLRIEMNEFEDNIAQIFLNDKLMAEYKFGGAGATHIYHLEGKKLIDLLVTILYEQADKTVEEKKYV